ncbi:hypothetical protein PghCCS26_37460 [Paenibacillus glycanilyticus]|uniref:Uncharacterized protein n=1 Tax=Paenibacillus glycanilyticus TaxID=126569 RepID=A0ABQ6NNC6_9BACL|nr:hypothetical protein PghCCS26_37460 [Paenibacillus glycanilyticus]
MERRQYAPSQPATLAAYERMYKWYKDTAIAIHNTFGYDLDYINPDRNGLVLGHRMLRALRRSSA